MLWTVKYGNGRVFVDAMGHDADAMTLPGFVATLARGAEWAATGEVTIPLPQELK
jgi:type 1 glutamine amidotransferase